MRIVVACIAAVVVSACSDPAGVAELGAVRVEARSSGLDIHNGRPSKVYTFIVDRVMDTLISWVPCTDPDTCSGVESGATRNVLSSEISGWGESPEVIVYWWHLVPETDDGYRPDRVRSMVVSP